MATVMKPPGPKFYTCQGCHTRVAIADACMTDESGEIFVSHVCERCQPAITPGVWIDYYTPQCDLCVTNHRGPRCQ